MKPEIHRTEVEIGGKILSFEIGRMANLSNSSVIVSYDDTECLVTAVMSEEEREGIDFLPLMVNFEERMYSAGKIPGGFIKREGRPSEPSVLAGRAIDRPIRPLFPQHFRRDIGITVMVLSTDIEDIPDIIGMNGATCALMLSDIPFYNTMAGVRIAKNGEDYIINPTYEQKDNSKFDVIVSGTRNKILMIEANTYEASEEEVLNLIKVAHTEIIKICDCIDAFRAKHGKEKIQVDPPKELQDDLRPQIEEIVKEHIHLVYEAEGKKQRDKVFKAIRDKVDAYLEETLAKDSDLDNGNEIKSLSHQYEYECIKKTIRKNILENGKRPDNRKPEDIRPIHCEVGISPRAHGTGLFTRGETQVLGTVTLGAPGNVQVIDDIHPYEEKRYLHHYQSLPFSFGDTGPVRGPGRREIGHGALAERALQPMIPDQATFPYIIRVNSDVMSSNGSTSMGATCASTIALMDAGVPIKKPVSGIAMGLVTDEDGKYVILNDLLGTEDFMGDMDFKVTGTADGITAIQMDTKISGLTMEMIEDILARAKEGRHHILGKMLEAISEPKKELSPYAPKITIIHVNPERIGDVIGPGGKIIKKIIEETGVEIDIEDDGRIYLTSIDADSIRAAKERIEALTEEVEVGRVYKGKVVRIEAYGAFVSIIPGKDGLLHVSQIGNDRVNRVSDVLKIGQEIYVKVQNVDELGRVDLTAIGVKDEEGNEINLLEGYDSSQGGGDYQKPRGGGGYDRRPSGGSRPPRRNPRQGDYRDRDRNR